MLLVGTPDTEDVGLPHGDKGLQVELGIEAAPDQTDAQPLARHLILQAYVALCSTNSDAAPATLRTAGQFSGAQDRDSRSSSARTGFLDTADPLPPSRSTRSRRR